MPRLVYDWEAIQRYHDEGHGFAECRRRFGVTHTAWNKAIATGRLSTRPTAFRDRRRRHDWAAVQAYYDEGHSYRECRARFGFCLAAWYKAIERGEIRPRPLGRPIEELLRVGKSRWNIKLRLFRAGLLENVCSQCGLVEWRGKPLAMHIDHINGVRDDHRLENLRMLCPNCHSQTETYGGRNLRRRKGLQDSAAAV